jgi:hypothetical protein
MSVERAREFFQSAHAGQVDQQGRDYYGFHLIPVAARLAHLGPEAEIAGLGHDWIEDVWFAERPGDLDGAMQTLERAGVPGPSIEAIVAVTRIPGESYGDLTERACTDPLATEVKIADNEVNILSNPGLAVEHPLKAGRLLVKYLKARDRLLRARAEHQQVEVLWRIYLGSCVCHLGDYGTTCTCRCEASDKARAALRALLGEHWHDICRTRYVTV